MSYAKNINEFLQEKTIVVIGRGITAGAPIARMIEKHGVTPTIIHSETKHPESLMKSGYTHKLCRKKHTVTKNSIKMGLYLSALAFLETLTAHTLVILTN